MSRHPIPIPGAPARVLIVDDEAANRQLLEVMLAPEGYHLLSASGGEEALALVAGHQPDLVLLDVMMPGMDGYEVAGAIKGHPATMHIPIIMVTVLGDRRARMRGLDAGAEDFLTTPIDRSELRARVRNLLRLKAYGDHYDDYSQALEREVGRRTAELAESERVYRETFDAAPVGIAHVDLDGRWVRVNQCLCDLLGYDRGDLQGMTGDQLLPPAAAARDVESRRRMIAGELDQFAVDEQPYQRPDGTVMWARVNTALHRDADGRARHFISVVEDITRRRMLEAQVRQAGKMDALGRVAAGVAHDFNNLLSVVLGFAETMRTDTTIAAQHAENLGEIVKAAQRGAGLTRQLLAFSRQQVLSVAPVDVNGLIADMTGMLGQLIGKHIEVALTLAPALPPALADRGQLEQVVMNLVVNARDAMPGGGKVSIGTADVALVSGALDDDTVVPGPYVMVAVTDSGEGMTPETRRRLFEPFFTTKEAGHGTGLGLATTYGVVTQSHGYVTVDSELGRGTTVKVYLPQSAPRRVDPSAPHVSRDVGLARAHRQHDAEAEGHEHTHADPDGRDLREHTGLPQAERHPNHQDEVADQEHVDEAHG